MRQIGNIEKAIIGTLIGLLILIIFNNPINDLIGENSSYEARLLMKGSFLLFAIAIAAIFPVGLATPDKEGSG